MSFPELRQCIIDQRESSWRVAKRRRLVSLAFDVSIGLAIALWFFVLAGCATAGRIDQQAERLTRDAITASEKSHEAGALTDDQFRQANVILHRVAVAGLAFTDVLIRGDATSADTIVFMTVVEQAVADLQGTFPVSIDPVLKKIADLRRKLQEFSNK